MKKIAILIVIGSLMSCQKKISKHQENTGEVINAITLTNELNNNYEKGHILGFSVAIVNKNKVVYQKGFGYSDVKKGKRYTKNTIQNIASISKTLIGTALLKAQEMGKLNLDDPINKHLAYEVVNPYYPEEIITIRHLATHTSTIKDSDIYGDKSYILKDKHETIESAINEMYVKFNQPNTHMPMSIFLEKILSANGEWHSKDGYLKNSPGKVFEYSNLGATLAAVVIEQATGQSFDSFTEEHILNPLKMSNSGWSFDKIDMTQHSRLYLNEALEIPFYTLITYPDGGLITSTNDLSKYLIELIKGYNGNGTILNQNSYKEFFTKQLKPQNFNDQNGENEGIFLSFNSEGLIGHSGGDPGVSTFMFFNPNTNVGKIVLVNTQLDEPGNDQYNMILKTLEDFERSLN